LKGFSAVRALMHLCSAAQYAHGSLSGWAGGLLADAF
jgi:hypothetical protein